ncbi:MAG TPA: hypothetical protein VIF37_08735 [Methylobacter sp.]|jgi:hypothetical protein
MTEKQFVQRFLKRSVVKSQAFFQLPLLLVIINHTNIGHGADFSPNLLPQQVRNFRSSPQPQPKKRCNYFDVNTESRILEWFRSGKNRGFVLRLMSGNENA